MSSPGSPRPGPRGGPCGQQVDGFLDLLDDAVQQRPAGGLDGAPDVAVPDSEQASATGRVAFADHEAWATGATAQVAAQPTYTPGALLVAAVTLAIAGLVARWSALAWAALAYVFLQALLGDTLRLPDWVDASSPF